MTTFEPGASDVLTHGLDFRPFCTALRASRPGAEHDRRVRGVRARGDRGDHDVAVVELGLGAVLERDRHGHLGALGDLQAAGAAVGGSNGCGAALVVAVVVAGGRRVRGRERVGARLVRVGLARPSGPRRRRAAGPRAPAGTPPWTRSATRGPAGASGRPATARPGRGRARACRCTSAPRSPRRATGPAPWRTPRRARRAPSGGRRTRGSAASRRRSGRSRRSSRTPATCCRSSRGRPAAARHARPEELDEHADDAALAQHLGDGEHEVGGGGALGQLAGELEAEHLRDQHRHRLAEHRRLGLDAADAPAEHAEAVDHRRVRVGPDERVGVGLQRALVRGLVGREHDARQVLEVDLVDDARCPAARPRSCRTRPGPSAGTRSAPGCARTRARR